MTIDRNSLRMLFDQIEATVGEGEHHFTSLPRSFALHAAQAKIRKFENAGDDEYFHELVQVIFSSGLPAQLASDRIHTLDERFADFRMVADYDGHHLSQVMDGPAMAKYDRKIRRIIGIAKSFRCIVSEFGSFAGYLNSMGGKDLSSAWAARTDLMRRFTFLGKCTSIRFLIEVGYPILKPDVGVMRVFARLRLVKPEAAKGIAEEHAKLNEAQVLAAMEVGYNIALATGKPIRYISEILEAFAQGPSEESPIGSIAICTEHKPNCFLCGVKDRCGYKRKTDLTEPEILAVLSSLAAHA